MLSTIKSNIQNYFEARKISAEMLLSERIRPDRGIRKIPNVFKNAANNADYQSDVTI